MTSSSTAGGDATSLSVANSSSSPLTLSNEDLSSTRSMSPRFNSTLVENGGGRTGEEHHANNN